VTSAFNPKRLRSPFCGCCEKQILPIPEGNYFISCTVDNKNWTVDVSNPIKRYRSIIKMYKNNILKLNIIRNLSQFGNISPGIVKRKLKATRNIDRRGL